jgi:hypothetical protein
MRKLVASLAAGLALVACAGHSQDHANQGDDAGTAQVNGVISGVSFPGAAYAIAVPNNESASGPPENQYTQLALAIAGAPLTCSTSKLPSSLFIGVQIIARGALPVGPGTYPIANDPEGSDDNVAALVTTDAQCTETAPANCIGGSITITATTATTITGSFTLAFDSGQTMTGSFEADVCTAVPAAVNDTPC